MTSSTGTRLTLARKLRVDAGAPRGRDDSWSAALARIHAELHSPDGMHFVHDVLAALESGEIPPGPWAGVVHDDRGGARALLNHPRFADTFVSCTGLWAMSDSGVRELNAAELPAPVAQFPETGTHENLERLAEDLANGAVYRTLPTPPSQAAELFRRFDLTIMLCSYKRVHNIGPILEAFCDQSYAGTFEVIIWNNNPEAASELEAAVAPYRSRLDLTLLHSSRNYYCIVRLAVAHLMRGEHLMICDDDVKPSPRYLEIFARGLAEAGDNAVICARGNTFRPHRMSLESPENVWEKWEHLDFWDVGAPPREIHFMHGSSCLVPKSALLQLSALELPNPEFILVDDYWLSYALSGRLGWKIWKIEASDAFRFDASAEDPEVALWLNPRVQQERTNFYVYHMLHGWPEGCSA